MSWYVHGAAISPFVKGVINVYFSVSAQSDYSHSVDQVHVHTFLPKQLMMSSEHCVVTSQ